MNDGGTITEKTYIDLEGEGLYVVSKEGNIIDVERGRDNTTTTPVLVGGTDKSINLPMMLIKEGDDFGFSGSYT